MSIDGPKALACGVTWIRMNEVENAEFERDFSTPIELHALNLSLKGTKRVSSIVKSYHNC